MLPVHYESAVKDLAEALPPDVSQDLWTETADKKTRKALRGVSDDIISKALIAITVGFPSKILELTDLIMRSKTDESSIFHSKWDSRRYTSAHTASPINSKGSFSLVGISSTNVSELVSKDLGSPQNTTTATTTRRISISQQSGTTQVGSLPSPISAFGPPAHVLHLWETLEVHIHQIIELLDLVQLYLILKTPIAEEGNNTGVEIQQQCSRTVVEARRFVLGCESYLKLYHTQRAKIASKCLKYPQIEDYQRALIERDREECRDCRYLLNRLRAQSLAVVDILHKNFEKVDDPKGLNRGGGGAVGMY
ncbi:proteasome activator pa28 [Phakopsora pachyrhizi]|uniref:Proteasome activator pa28 n=1 Tax=Phakopsora pachyrhizi TaxID=170000 RepID=A0AAV0AQX0_PHAPC|nr:proteasome activator pa28 [Phakopsora pachyrhizi]CAH7671646.1 proteasome activator pa28 [Phakopsora pachyrhizi]